MRHFFLPSLVLLALLPAGAHADSTTAVPIVPVVGRHAMVVAGHPEAAAAGVEVLRAGGNAIDAAVAVSTSLGVCEPYASGLGGKLMLLYYEAASGRTFAVEAMDAGGTIDVAQYRRRPDAERSSGYGSACVPGLVAGLWTAHQHWGKLPWARDFADAIHLAENGFEVLPKTRDFFEEQTKKLHAGDPELARIYLPGGAMPAIGSRLKSIDLGRTLQAVALGGRDAFYRGPVAAAIAQACAQGGEITREDLARYEAHLASPLEMDFRGYHLLAAPPPASGPALFLTVLKVLESADFGGGPLRTVRNLNRIGEAWRVVRPEVQRDIADSDRAVADFQQLISPASVARLRARAAAHPAKVSSDLSLDGSFSESAYAATTHFIVVDTGGNVVCATQSLSLHFGAGVVPPGTGIVLNDSMSNFNFSDPANPNFVATGRRPRSTISPTIVFQGTRPVIAIGIPGAARIPTAMIQGLLDRLALQRPLEEAIGDTRCHFVEGTRGEPDAFEAENSLSPEVAAGMQALGWKVVLAEAAGRGRHFGGLNAVEIRPDGTLVGLADPRRTNVAAGW